MGAIARLDSREADFTTQLEARLVEPSHREQGIETTVQNILTEVREHGDAALLALTNRFDHRNIDSAAELVLDSTDFVNAFREIKPADREALETATTRIRQFHEHQRQASWDIEHEDGTRLGQKITALDRVGIYVPGGKAAYPSSVLMNAVPASVAGVSDVLMAVPAPQGELSPLVLAAAHLAGVSRGFTVGGAQAIAAFAYGTETVPHVDKIVGPGRDYVATAKRLVFGQVGIDMVAGPSEIVIICDGSTPPEWIVADLFSQAEHDESARALLISPNEAFLEEVQQMITRMLPTMARREIITCSLERCGALIRVRDLEEAVQLANYLAPEHLELSVQEPEALLEKVRHAGAIFLGKFSSEVLGDYCAGPNHVLPTGRTARFSSPLGVYDFQKRTNIIGCSAATAVKLGRVAEQLAQGEGLSAHALSARMRYKGIDSV